MHDLCDRTQRISVVIVVKQMSYDLGICIRDKLISLIDQLFLQLQIILYNTIVHHSNGAILIQMRMRIYV